MVMILLQLIIIFEVWLLKALLRQQETNTIIAFERFREGKKESTVGELNKSYEAICKSSKLRHVGIMELSNMCRALNDQVAEKLMVIHKGCLVGDYPALEGNWKFEVAFRMVLFLSNYSLFEFVFFRLLKKELMIE